MYSSSSRKRIPSIYPCHRNDIGGRVVHGLSWFLLLLILMSMTTTIYAVALNPIPEAVTTSTRTTTSTSTQRRRRTTSNIPRALELGDFDSINGVLSGTTFELPSTSQSQGSTTLNLSNIRCRNVNVGDIRIFRDGTTEIGKYPIELSIVHLDLICDANYRYSGIFISGSGGVTVTSSNSDVTVTGAIVTDTSTGDSSTPPSSIVLDKCQPSVQIENINFEDDGIVAWILDLVEGLSRGIMENAVEKLLCEELESARIKVEEILFDLNDKLDSYPMDFIVDPLESEMALLQKEEDTIEKEWLDLSTPQTTFGRWMRDVLDQGIRYLQRNVTITVEEGGKNITKSDMQANVLIRNALNGDRGLVVLDPNTDDVWPIFYEHDVLLETSITISRVQILGLDTLKILNPMEFLGDYTFQSQVKWESISVEVDAMIDMRPSSLDDAVVNGEEGYIEEVTVIFGLSDVEATVAILTVIQQELLESLRIGSLLTKTDLLPCLLSTFYRELEFSAFTINAGDIISPVLSQLQSPGLYRIVNQVLDTTFDLYETVLLERATAIFQQDFRRLLNEQVNTFWRTLTVKTGEEKDDGVCPPPAVLGETIAPASFMDFRDLLLNPYDAWVMGATGKEPYGDLISSFIAPELENEVMTAELFNSRVIGSATKAQSGKAGTFNWADFVLMNYTSNAPTSLYDMAVIQVSRPRIHNLDIVQEPLNILDARDWNSLYQTITLASDERPLKLMSRFLVAIGSDTSSSLVMNNQWDLSITIPSVAMELGILAHMKEEDFLQFPLGDVTNPYCWLATMEEYIDERENGETITLLPLVMETLGFAVPTFRLNAECIRCTSPGAKILGELLSQDLPAAGFQDVFTSRIVKAAEELVQFYWNAIDMDELMEQAKSRCPHRNIEPQILIESDNIPFSGPGFSLEYLSTDSLDTMMGLGIITLYSAVAIGARNQLLLAEMDAAGAGVQVKTAGDEHSEGLDWTNLSPVLGDWADLAFNELREYLVAPVPFTDGTSPNKTEVQLVHFLKKDILDENGILVIPLTTEEGLPGLDDVGLEVFSAQMEIRGLDTMTVLELLVPTERQGIYNSFDFETVSIAFEARVKIGSTTENVRLAYRMQNLSIAFDLILSTDMSAMKAIKIGSIFQTEDILSCFASGISFLKLSNISSSVGDLEGPLFSGFFDSDFQESIESIISSIAEKYHDDIVAAWPIFLKTSFKEILNDAMPALLERMRDACPSAGNFPEDSVLDFRELLLSPERAMALGAPGTERYGNLFRILYDLLVEKVLRTGASNRPLINDIFRHFTSEQSNVSGTYSVQDEVFASKSRIVIAGLDATLGLELFNLSIENIDSVGDPLELANPIAGEPSIISNTISFGVDSKPVRVALSFVLTLSDGADMDIRNEIDISLALEDIRIMADILLMISEKSFSDFPIGDLPNVNCWLATVLPRPSGDALAFRAVDLEEQDFRIGNFSLEVNCVDCTSPYFDELLLSLYNVRNVTELEDVIRDRAESDSRFVPAMIDQIVSGSSKRCPHHEDYDPNSEPLGFISPRADSQGWFGSDPTISDPLYFRAVNISIAVVLFASWFLAWTAMRRRNKNWVESLDGEAAELFAQQQKKENLLQSQLDSETMSLLTCPAIPRRVRYGVPIVILLNVGIYLGGHLGVLSIVNIDAAVAGEVVSIERFLEFRFIDSTRDTFMNGGVEMAVLLWIFTGIWPYIKLVGCMLAWVLPPSKLSVQRRGLLLLWLDALAKLSLIDIVTLLLGFAVVLIFIGGRDKALTSSETTLYAFKVIIVPNAGFYCLIIAQRLSRVSSRFLLEYHDIVVNNATRGLHPDNDDALQSYADEKLYEGSSIFTGDESRIHGNQSGPRSDSGSGDDESLHEADSQKPERRWGTIGAICAGFTVFVVFVIGCILAPAIALDTTSFAGLAAESGMTYEDIVEKYGVFLVISSILVRVRFVLDSRADYVGLGLLLFVGLGSMAWVFLLQAHRFIKRKLKERTEVPKVPSYGHRGCGLPFYLNLYRWRHVEIYLISVSLGFWQLGSAVSYAIYLYCEVLRQLYSVMEVLGLVVESSAQCDLLQAKLPENLAILGGTAALLLGTFAFQTAAQHKKNTSDAMRFVDDDDIPSLSMAWSSERSKNGRYSHATMSIGEYSDECRILPSTPVTTTLNRSGRSLELDDTNETISMDASTMQSSISPSRSFDTASLLRDSSHSLRTKSVRFDGDS